MSFKNIAIEELKLNPMTMIWKESNRAKQRIWRFKIYYQWLD